MLHYNRVHTDKTIRNPRRVIYLWWASNNGLMNNGFTGSLLFEGVLYLGKENVGCWRGDGAVVNEAFK